MVSNDFLLETIIFKIIIKMSEAVLRIKNLSHRYSVKWAIKDINLEIDKKGIYGLLGSNGAGKSTTMNIMCGVIKQTEGSVEICGYDTITNAVESRKKIGFLPQKPPVHPEMTVYEYLHYTTTLRLIPKDEVEQAIEDVLNVCNLGHMRDRLISNLSGGYQQRVGIAQAIIHRPEVVIFDEPTNGLDPNQIIDIRDLIRNIAKERTVILSTHMLSEVQAVCDRIIMIEHGNIIFNGSVRDFNNHVMPDTVFVTLLEMPAEEDLLALEDVMGVEMLGDNNYRLKCQNPRDVVKNVVKASVEKGWDLDAIYVEKSSMDDIFAVLSNNK